MPLVTAKIKKMIHTVSGFPIDELSLQTHLQNDLQFTEDEEMDLADEIEEEYEIGIPDSEWPFNSTIDFLVKYIKSKAK